METIKTAFGRAMLESYGEHVLLLEDKTNDVYFKLQLMRCPEHVIYLRLDGVFHYALIEDMRENTSAELRAWKQQMVFRLVRRCKAGDFVSRACAYVRDAVEHIEQHRGVSGRGMFAKVRTFEEVSGYACSNFTRNDLVSQAKYEAKHFPRPKKPRAVIPPPVCRRHADVHRKKKRS